MTPKQFIEKAVEGGYTHVVKKNFEGDDILAYEQSNARIFLDPLAWQAVGKVEVKNWGQIEWVDRTRGREMSRSVWEGNMHRMIDSLCEGKSVEEFLSEL